MAHAQKPDFLFPQNGRVHLNRWGRQFSRLLAAEVCTSAWVMLGSPRSEVAWEYWLPTPFASFPFTSPPLRHCVPPGSERALTVLKGLNNCISFCWRVKTWCTKGSHTSIRTNCPYCSKPFHLMTETDPIYKTLCCFWNITQWTEFRNCIVLRFHFTLLTTSYPSYHIISHHKTSISFIKLHRRLHLLTPDFAAYSLTLFHSYKWY